tara:strand:- start:2611 stop:3075 length:465 start_codon:yes stop_codon:yes gene_type:complete
MNVEDLELKYKELGAEIERLKAQPTYVGVWKPEIRGVYWGVRSDGTCFDTSRCTDFDESVIAQHNVYKTKELSKKASVLQRRSNLVIQACLNVDPDFEPDWSDQRSFKYGFYYDHDDLRWERQPFNFYNFGPAYVSTAEKADQVLEYLNSQELK